MSLTIALPLLVATLGALAYLLADKAELREMGRIAFAVGLLLAVAQAAGRSLHF